MAQSQYYERPLLNFPPWENTIEGKIDWLCLGGLWKQADTEQKDRMRLGTDHFPVLISYVFQVSFVLHEVLWILKWNTLIFSTYSLSGLCKFLLLFMMVETSELTIIQSNYCSLAVKVPCYSFHKYPGWSEPSSLQSLFFCSPVPFHLLNL